MEFSSPSFPFSSFRQAVRQVAPYNMHGRARWARDGRVLEERHGTGRVGMVGRSVGGMGGVRFPKTKKEDALGPNTPSPPPLPELHHRDAVHLRSTGEAAIQTVGCRFAKWGGGVQQKTAYLGMGAGKELKGALRDHLHGTVSAFISVSYRRDFSFPRGFLWARNLHGGSFVLAWVGGSRKH